MLKYLSGSNSYILKVIANIGGNLQTFKCNGRYIRLSTHVTMWTMSELRMRFFGSHWFLQECLHASKCDLRHLTNHFRLRFFSGGERKYFIWMEISINFYCSWWRYQSSDGRFASGDVFPRFLSTSIRSHKRSQCKFASEYDIFTPQPKKSELLIGCLMMQITFGCMWTLP